MSRNRRFTALGTRAPSFAGTSTDGKVCTFAPDRYEHPTIVISSPIYPRLRATGAATC